MSSHEKHNHCGNDCHQNGMDKGGEVVLVDNTISIY
jgi:hypothetical protein